MTRNEENRDAKLARVNQEFDRELDALLALYAAVEPRAGLEARILANLQAEQARVPNPVWWRWSLATLAAVVVITLALAWRTGKPWYPMNASRSPISEASKVPERPVAPHAGVAGQNAPKPGFGPHYLRPAPTRPTKTPPRLDQFPSAQPLSEQEKILARYVMRFPHQAVLIARVSSEELKRDRAQVMGTAPESVGPADGTDQKTTNK
jgi:hypothetical protein